MRSALQKASQQSARAVSAILFGFAAAYLLAIIASATAPAADRFSEALGAAPLAVLPAPSTVGAGPWESLASLGSDVELAMTLPRDTVEAGFATALDRARSEPFSGDGASLTFVGQELAFEPQRIRLVLRARLDGAFFSATIAASATLDPTLDPKGVAFSRGKIATGLETASLKRPTLNPTAAAAKAEPVIRAAEAHLSRVLNETVGAVGMPLALALPEVAAEKRAGKSAAPRFALAAGAFMIDAAGLHVLGRLSGPRTGPDDAILTGSLGSAGLTVDQYRAAFDAVRARTLGVRPDVAGGDLVIATSAMAGLVGNAGSTSCAPAAIETDPVIASGVAKLAEPPPAPACRRIAESCAARELCGHESECQDRIVERTVQETVKVPFQRDICRHREFVCYGWGPYGCAYGENVCVAPDRVTEFREKVVERVVAETTPAASDVCTALRDLKTKQPGVCGEAAKGESPECGLVTSGGLDACEAKSSLLNRMRGKPQAQIGARLVTRGRIEVCTTRTLSDDLRQAKLSTIGSGKAEAVAEVTLRPEGRGEDGEIRCSLSTAPALKAAAKIRFERTSRAAVEWTTRDGKLLLATPASQVAVKIGPDKAAVEQMFAGGLAYRCSIAGSGPNAAPFAAWESKVSGSLREVVGKAGAASATVAVPAIETELPAPELLGRPTSARLDGDRIVFSVRD